MDKYLNDIIKEYESRQHKSLFARFRKWFFSLNYKLILLLLATSVFTSIAINKDLVKKIYKFNAGQIATKNIVSPKTFEVIDRETTRAKIQTTLDSVLNVWDYDQKTSYIAVDKVKKIFELERKQNITFSLDQLLIEKKKNQHDELLDKTRKEISSIVEGEIGDNSFNDLLDSKFSKKHEKILLNVISKINSNYIVPSKELLPIERNRGVAIKKIYGGDVIGEDILQNANQILDIEEARKNIENEEVYWSELPQKSRDGFIQLAKQLIKPNLTFNRQETEKRRDQAKNEVKPVTLKIKKGDFIIKRGDTIEKWHLLALKGLEFERIQEKSWDKTIFMGLMFFLFLLSLGKMMSVLFKRAKFEIKDLFLVFAIMILEIAVVKVFLYVSTEALRDKFTSIPLAFYYYMIPVAATALIVRMLLSKEIAFVFSIFNAMVYGMLLEFNLYVTLFTFITSIAGVVSSTYIKTRWSIYRTGAIIGLLSVVSIYCIGYLNPELFANDMYSEYEFSAVFWMSLAGVLNGLLSAVLVIGAVPLFEFVFSYTTDMTLLELSSFEHPLMKNMIVNASGTYNHCARMAILAESAAEAIGANPLLARVGAYYHDIGKSEKPTYFTENQEGFNKHDKLSPHMSALIIKEHVRRGIELANRYKLPKPVKDMIQQHHGTGLIAYFYNKARSNPESGHEVHENDFRYDGPKPQTREAAIVMMSDSVEAATNSLTDVGTSKVAGVVNSIINKFFADGQLSESELTLKDLDLIAKSFIDAMRGMYHQRIDYKTILFKKASEKNESGDTKQNTTGEARSGYETPKENLKRLGLDGGNTPKR